MAQSPKDAWETAVPVNPDHINATGGVSCDRKEIRELIDCLQAAAGAVISELSPVSVSCKVSRIASISRTFEDPSQDLHCFSDRSHRLHAWLSSDRGFGSLLSELAFGGAGRISSKETVGSVISKVEQRLTCHVLKELADKFAEVISETSHSTLDRMVSLDPADLELLGKPQRLLEIRLIFEAGQISGEIGICFIADEIKHLILESADAKKEFAPFDIVKKTKFELLSLLPPDEVPLGTLLALKPGSQLSLSITVESPIIIVCGSEVVFEGDCDPTGDKIDIHLRSWEGAHDEETAGVTQFSAVSGAIH